MSTPAHLQGVPVGREFSVACGDGSVRHTGAPFRDYGRAEHWSNTADAVCCTRGHHVIPVITGTGGRP